MDVSVKLLNATAAFIAPPSDPNSLKKALQPRTGAPLSADTTLVPSKSLPEKAEGTTTTFEDSGIASSVSLHPVDSYGGPAINLVRSPPSQLLDAPARAALNMPNLATAKGQARAVRGVAQTPEYEIDISLLDTPQANGEQAPLLSPTPVRPGISRSASNASTSSARGMLRRIFIDRASTPSQHLSRPTFPPPSLSTYSPLPHTPLNFRSKINLFINQTISLVLSTFFLIFVVIWAVGAELVKALPKWLRPMPAKKFPWDDEAYWKKQGKKISKNPTDYAHQVGMDIEHQTVETLDGYYLK